jgi:hypothetical protein
VKYTLKQLEAAQATTQFIIRNIDIPTNSGINVVENRVELYVVERSRFDVAMQDTRIQLPPQVKVVTVSELGVQETDIYGGLVLSACNSGFSVINLNGIKGITTAAHCPNLISYNGVNLTFRDEAYGGPYDFQWHTAPGFYVRNWVYDGSYNHYILWTKSRYNQAVGDWVCKHGVATGYTCGAIIDKNYYPGSPMNSTLIRIHSNGVNLSEPGDSGCPWFLGNTAYGSHVGGIGDDAYYMAINYIDYLGLSVLTDKLSLPIVLKGITMSLKEGSPEFYNPYPSPNDKGTSIKSPSTPEPNPYP